MNAPSNAMDIIRRRQARLIDIFSYTLAEAAIKAAAKEVCRYDSIGIRVFKDDIFTDSEKEKLKKLISNVFKQIAEERTGL